MLAYHVAAELALVSVAMLVAIVGGIWGLLRQSHKAFADSVEAIVCKHISPVRKDLDALKTEVKADHLDLRRLVVANAKALHEVKNVVKEQRE